MGVTTGGMLITSWLSSCIPFECIGMQKIERAGISETTIAVVLVAFESEEGFAANRDHDHD